MNCIFSGNSAAFYGGGMVNSSGSSVAINCTFSGNTAGLSGGGLYVTGDGRPPLLLNSIVWGNSDSSGQTESGQIFLEEEGSIRVYYSSIQAWSGIFGGVGNIGGDPQFVDPDGADNVFGTLDDNLRLSADSACIDAAANLSAGPDKADVDGDGDTVEALPFDFDGSLRFVDILGSPDTGLGFSPLVDMGGYERIADCNSNALPDEQDIADGTSQDCNRDGLPDECQVSSDCNGNGACDEEDCNDNGAPDECEADCNNNGVQDECDIAEDDSDDCNQDGVPDECLDGETDCNDNGLVDGCEVADGVTPDENDNGVPDDCEPAVLFVDAEASGRNTGLSWGDAFNALQDALAVAGNSAGFVQQVWVAAGVYTPDEPGFNRAASFQLVSGVAVYGGFAGGEIDLEARDPMTNETVLSGDLNRNDTGELHDFTRLENSLHVVTGSGTDSGAVLDGFTITGGRADGPSVNFVDFDGAGMRTLSGSPTVVDCVFAGNYAGRRGAAVQNSDSSHPSFVDCTFIDNMAGSYAAGVLNSGHSNPTFLDCAFTNNQAIAGGAAMQISNYCSPTLTNCTFTNNSVTGPATYAHGGAIRNGYYCNTTLTGCIFEGNTAEDEGGAFYNDDYGSAAFDACIFRNNAALRGGAVFAESSIYFDNELTLNDCTFVGNSAVEGGAMEVEGHEILSNCTFLGNQSGDRGGALYFDGSAAAMVNCLFSGNHAGSRGGAMYAEGSVLTVTNCTISQNTAQDEWGGIGNFGSLTRVTNCILWGNSDENGVGEESQIDGGTISYSCVQGWSGLLGGEGNFGEDPIFVDPEGDDNMPGTEDDDLRVSHSSPCVDVGNNDVDTDREEPGTQYLPLRDLADKPRFIDIFDVPDNGNGTSPIVDLGVYEHLSDCNGNGIQDAVDIDDGTSNDDNGNAIPDECEVACGTEYGVGEDCTNNGIPDNCEADCNNNLVADSCDIAAGTSQDCNADGIPDDCEPYPPITGQPQDQEVEPGELALFGVAVDGILLEYQWRKDGVGLQDDGRIIGSQSSLLIILEVILEDAGEYDCVITDLIFGCEITSDTATLIVLGPCPADFDGDGTVGASDLAQLLGSWGPCAGCLADLDGDGDVDAADLATLLGAWGPCK